MLFDSSHRENKDNPRLKRSWKSTIQKLVMTSILVVGLPLSVNYAEANDTEEFKTIHHVYYEDEYIGLLADEDKLITLTEEKLNEAKQEYEGLTVAIQEGLSVIPERVFSVTTNDEKVLTQLDEMLSVETAGVGIQIGDTTALYVKDEAQYEEVINAFTLQAVSAEELAAYEASQEAGATLPELGEGETRIAKIVFSAEMEAVGKKVHPKEILTVAEAVEVLNTGAVNPAQYVVKSGDVLGKIAKAHQMTTQELLQLNEGITSETLLQIGDELHVTSIEPYVEVEVHYESKKRQPIAHEKTREKDAEMDKGQQKVIQEGQDGEKVTVESIRKKNGQIIEQSTVDEEILSEPVAEITVVGTKVTPSKGTGTFSWPTVGGYVSSQMGQRWGRMHRGIDIARPSNHSILAADNGVVVSTGHDGSYGNKIVIDHNNGYRTLYAHLSSISVKPGQVVSAGSTIGVMGRTGNSTGIHLHFEVTKNGSLVNPMSVLK